VAKEPAKGSAGKGVRRRGQTYGPHREARRRSGLEGAQNPAGSQKAQRTNTTLGTTDKREEEEETGNATPEIQNGEKDGMGHAGVMWTAKGNES